MADLPLEVIIDIISRSPVKAILGYRRVSKPWKSLIDDPNFIDLHLKKSIDTQTHFRLILKKDSELFSVDLDSFDSAVEINHPLMCYGHRIRIWGSCNGILCLCNVAEDIALWNPSTRKYCILPSLPVQRRRNTGVRFCFESYGLGFDAVHNDFKLLKISQLIGLNRVDFDSDAKVFSLRNSSWKSIQSIPYALCYNSKMGIFVDGALHWVVARNLDMGVADFIVAFDLEIEKFREVPLPEFIERKCEIHVELLGGCLCLLLNYDEVRFELWVMKEYGVRESWKKLLSVSQSDFIGRIKTVRPLSYSKTGYHVLLLQDCKKLIWYDLRSQKIDDAKISGIPCKFEAEVLVESLISLDAYKGNSEKNLEDERFLMDDFLSEGFKLVL